MKRAVVLGGGGVIGVAWESGLCAGLRDLGIELSDADAVVGTSAGAIVGARLLAGKSLTPRAAQAEDRRRLGPTDPEAARRIFELWAQMEEPRPEELARIGAIARELLRDQEATFVARMEALGVDQWPAGRLRVLAVDTVSGERRVFERDSGAPIAHVLAASAAVPGLFPSVTIEGKRYMDGQVHSSTHLDVLLPERPAHVLVAMPTNPLTANALGRQAERALSAERAQLEAQGSDVVLCTPDEASVQRFGSNLMDARKAEAAYDAGRVAAQALAPRLRNAW